MVEYRGLIANISSAAWSNTEKSEARDGIFIHQKSDEGNVYTRNWNRLPLSFSENNSHQYWAFDLEESFATKSSLDILKTIKRIAGRNFWWITGVSYLWVKSRLYTKVEVYMGI